MEQVYVCCAQRRARPIVSAALSALLEAVVLRVVGASLAVAFFRREWLVLRMRSRLCLALQRKQNDMLRDPHWLFDRRCACASPSQDTCFKHTNIKCSRHSLHELRLLCDYKRYCFSAHM